MRGTANLNFYTKKIPFVLNSTTDDSGKRGEYAVVFVYQNYRPYLSTYKTDFFFTNSSFEKWTMACNHSQSSTGSV